MANLLIIEEPILKLSVKQSITMSGTVTEEGHPVSNRVLLYDWQTGLLVATTNSDPSTGAYSFAVQNTEAYQYVIVCMPDSVSATSIQAIAAGQNVEIHMTFIPSTWFAGKKIRISDGINEELITINSIAGNSIWANVVNSYNSEAILGARYNALICDQVHGE